MLLQYFRVSSAVLSGRHELASWLQQLKVEFMGLPVQNAHEERGVHHDYHFTLYIFIISSQ